jgi:tetratricopeptide (TPR) repeat protein
VRPRHFKNTPNCVRVVFLILLSPLLSPAGGLVYEAGDHAFARINYPRAAREYERLRLENPNDPELLWRLARLSVCMAETAEGAERDRLLVKAEEDARHCLRSDSTLAEGHTWLAAALGYIGYFAGTGEQVRLAWEILGETDRAIALRPDDDAAYSIRGSLYRALGNAGWLRRQLARLFVGRLPPGGFQEGEEALQRAIALAPDVMRHRYELAVLYLDWGKTEQAKECLEAAQTLPVRVAIDQPRLEKIRQLLLDLEESRK